MKDCTLCGFIPCRNTGQCVWWVLEVQVRGGRGSGILTGFPMLPCMMSSNNQAKCPWQVLPERGQMPRVVQREGQANSRKKDNRQIKAQCLAIEEASDQGFNLASRRHPPFFHGRQDYRCTAEHMNSTGREGKGKSGEMNKLQMDLTKESFGGLMTHALNYVRWNSQNSHCGSSSSADSNDPDEQYHWPETECAEMPGSKQAKSASTHAPFLDDYIWVETDSGWFSGPYVSLPHPTVISSFLGVIPKKEPGSFLVIHDLSYPKCHVVNYLIPQDLSSIVYYLHFFSLCFSPWYRGRVPHSWSEYPKYW